MDQSHHNKTVSRSLLGTILEDSVFDDLGDTSETSFTLIRSSSNAGEPGSSSTAGEPHSPPSQTLVPVAETPPNILRKRIEKAAENNKDLNNELDELSKFTKWERQLIWAEKNSTLVKENRKLTDIIVSLNGVIIEARDNITKNDDSIHCLKEIIQTHFNPDSINDQGICQRIEGIVSTNAQVYGLLQPVNVPEPPCEHLTSRDAEHLDKRALHSDNMELLDKINSLEIEKLNLMEEIQQMEEDIEDFKRHVAESASSAYFENVEMATQLLPKFVDDFKKVTNQLAEDSFKLSPFLVRVTELINGIVGTLQPGYDSSQTDALAFNIIEKYESELSEKSLKEEASRTAFEELVTVAKELESFTPALNTLEHDVASKVSSVEENLSNLDKQVKEMFVKNTESFKLKLTRRDERISLLEEKLAAAKLDIESKYKIIEKDLSLFKNLTMNDSFDQRDKSLCDDESSEDKLDVLKLSIQRKIECIKNELAKTNESLNKAEEEKFRCEQRLMNEITVLKNEIGSTEGRFDPNVTTLLNLDVTGINEFSDGELEQMKLALQQAREEAAKIVEEKEKLIQKMSAELVAVRSTFDPDCTTVMGVDVSGINSDLVEDLTTEELRKMKSNACQLEEKVNSLQLELNDAYSSKERVLSNLQDVINWASNLSTSEQPACSSVENVDPLREIISATMEKLSKLESEHALKLEELEKMRSESLQNTNSLQEEVQRMFEEHSKFIDEKREVEIALKSRIEALENENESFKPQYDPDASGLMSLNVTQLNEFNLDYKLEIDSLKTKLRQAESDVNQLHGELKIRQDALDSEKRENEEQRNQLEIIVQQLNDDIASRQREVDLSKEQLAALRVEHEDLLKSHEDLKTVCDGYKKDISQYIEDLELASKELEGRKLEFQPVNQQLAELEEKINAVCDENDHLRGERESLNEELKRLNELNQCQKAEIDSNEELEGRIAALSTQLEQAETDRVAKDSELAELQDRVDSSEEAKKAEIHRLEDKLKSADDQNDRLTAQNEELLSNLEHLKALELEVETYKISVESKQAEIIHLKEELGSMENRITTLTIQIDESEALRASQLAEAEARLQMFNSSEEGKETELHRLAEELKSAEDRIVVLVSQIEELQSNVSEIEDSKESELAVALTELEAFKASEESKLSEISRLNEELKSVNDRATDLITKINESEALRVAKESELDEVQAQLDSFSISEESKESEIHCLRDELKSAEDRIGDLTTQNEGLACRVETLKASEFELAAALTELETRKTSEESKQKEINHLNEQVKNMEDRITALIAQIGEAGTLRVTKESEIDELHVRLDSYSGSEESKESEILLVGEKLKSAEDRIDHLIAQNLELFSHVETLKTLESELAAAQTELDVRKASEETKQKEIGHLKEELKSVTALITQIDEFDALRVTKQSELDELRARLDSYSSSESEILRLGDKLKSAEDRIDDLTTRNEELLSTVEALGASNESELSIALSQLERVKASEEENENEIQRLKENVKTLDDRIVSLTSQKAELLSTVENLKASKELDLQNAIEELETYKSSSCRLDSEMTELKQETEKLKACLEDAQINFKELKATKESELSTVLSELEQLKAAAETKENEIQCLKENVKTLDDRIVSLSCQKDELLATVENLKASKESDLQNAIEELETYKTSSCSLSSEMTELKQETEKLKACLEYAQINFQELKASKDSELSTVLSELEQVKAAAETKESEIQCLKENVKTLEDHIDSLTSQKNELLSTVENLKSDLQNAIEELEKYKSSSCRLDSEITELKQEAEKLKACLEDAQINFQELKASKESELSTVLSELEELKAAAETKESEIQCLKENVKTLDDRIVSLSGQKDELLSTVENLKASKECDLQNAIEELEKYKTSSCGLDSEMAELKQETDNLKVCLERAQINFQELEFKLHESESLNASLNKELAKSIKECEDLKQSVAQQRNDIARLTYESNLVQTQCSSMKTKHESLLSNHESLQQELAAKEDQLASSANKLIQLTRSLEQFKADKISIDEINEERRRLLNRLEEIEKEKLSAVDELSSCKLQIENQSAEMSELRGELEDLKYNLAELKHTNEEAFKSLEELEQFKTLSNQLRIQITTLQTELNLLDVERCDLKCELEMKSHVLKSSETKKEELNEVKQVLEDRCNEVKRLEKTLNDMQQQVASLTVQLEEKSAASEETQHQLVALTAQLDEKTAAFDTLKQAFALFKEQTVTDVDGFLEKSVWLGGLNCGNQTAANLEVGDDPLMSRRDDSIATSVGIEDNDEGSTSSSAFGTPTAMRFTEGDVISNAVTRRLRLSDEASELQVGIMNIFNRWNDSFSSGRQEADPEPLSPRVALERLGDAVEDAVQSRLFLMKKRPSTVDAPASQPSVKSVVENLFNEYVCLSADNQKLKTVLTENSEKLNRLNSSLSKLKIDLAQLKSVSSAQADPIRDNFDQLRSFVKDIVEKAREVEDLRESLSFCQNEYGKLESSYDELKKANRDLATQYEDRERSFNSLLEQNSSMNELQSQLVNREAECDKYKETITELELMKTQLEDKLSVVEKSTVELSDRFGRVSEAVHSLINFSGQPIDLSGVGGDTELDVLLSLKGKIEEYNRDFLSAICQFDYDSSKGTVWEFFSRLPSIRHDAGGHSDERITLLESQLIQANDFKVKFVGELVSLEPSLSANQLMDFTPEDLLRQMLSVIMEKEGAVIENIQLEAQKAQQSLKSQLADLENEVEWRKEKLVSSESDRQELSIKLDRLEEEIDTLKREKGSMNETYTVCSKEDTSLKEKLASMTSELAQKDRECEDLKNSLKELEARVKELDAERGRIAEAVSKNSSNGDLYKEKVIELEAKVSLLEEEKVKLTGEIREKETLVEKAQLEKSENETHLLSLQKIMKELKESCAVMNERLDGKFVEINELRRVAAQHEKTSARYEETLVTKECEINQIKKLLNERNVVVQTLESRLSGFEERVAALQTEARELQETNENLRVEVARLEMSLEEQRNEITSTLDTSAQIDLPSDEITRLNGLVASLEARCEGLMAEKQNLQSFKQQCLVLQSKLVAEDDRFTRIKKNLQEDLNFKTSKINELNRRLEEYSSSHDRDMQALQSALKSSTENLEKEIQVLKSKEKRFDEKLFSQRTVHVKEKAALEEQITKSAHMLRSQREELVQFLDHVSKAVGNKVVSIESACAAVTKLKENYEEEKIKAVDLDEECDVLKNQIDAMNMKEVEYFELNEELESSKKLLTDELRDIRETLSAETSKVVALKQKLAEYKGKLTASRQLAAESENLVSALKAEQKKTSELTLSLRAINEQLEECRLNLRNTRDELKHARNSMDDLQATKSALYDEFCTLKNRADASEQLLVSLKGETETELCHLRRQCEELIHKVSLKDKQIYALESDVSEMPSLKNKLAELNKQLQETRVLHDTSNRVVDVRPTLATDNSQKHELKELEQRLDKLSRDRAIMKKLCQRRKAQINFYENIMKERNISVPEFHYENA